MEHILFKLSKNFRIVIAVEPEEHNYRILTLSAHLLRIKNVLLLVLPYRLRWIDQVIPF